MIDDPLGSEERALLAAGRDRLGPDAAAIARLRGRIDAAVAKPGGGSLKLASLAVVTVVVVATVGALVQTRASLAIVPSPEISVASDEISVPHVTTVTLEPAAPPPVVVEPRFVRSAAEPAAASSPPPPALKLASLAREIELVDRATAALHHGELAAVLDTIQIYDAETAGQGQLAQDAAAIEIEARCHSNDDAAAGKLATFDQRWPRSAQRTRLTAACPQLH